MMLFFSGNIEKYDIYIEEEAFMLRPIVVGL